MPLLRTEKVPSLLRLRLRTLLAVIASFGLALALVIQERRASNRERELRKQLFIAQALLEGYERRRGLLGDMGIVILEEASRAEVFRVTGPFREDLRKRGGSDVSGGYPIAFTGTVLDRRFVSQLAGDFININNYINTNSFDDPNPMFGVRLWRGGECLDILMSLETSGNRHLDVFAYLKDVRGKTTLGVGGGYIYWPGGVLERLASEVMP